jgi:hypothetical protein
LTDKPAAFETTTTDLGADMAGDVKSTLAPVQARTAENTTAAGCWQKRTTEAGEEPFSGRCQLTTFVAQNDALLSRQRVRDGDA